MLRNVPKYRSSDTHPALEIFCILSSFFFKGYTFIVIPARRVTEREKRFILQKTGQIMKLPLYTSLNFIYFAFRVSSHWPAIDLSCFVFHECFCKTYHEIPNTRYTLFIFHSNFAFC